MKNLPLAVWMALALLVTAPMGALAEEAPAVDDASGAPGSNAEQAQGEGAIGSGPTADGPQIEWTPGPATVELGDELAQIELPEGFLFADAQVAQTVLSMMGNRVFGNEVGMVVPAAEGQDWFLVFEWEEVGYVKDDEKDSIDADALLESLQESTLAGNEWRKENGVPSMTMTGWAEPPHYDEKTHNLVWATQLDSEDGSRTVNHNVRLLGRRGIMSVTLVESTELYAQAKAPAEQVLKAFSFKTGSTYSEWKSGDKVAEYGLTALVAAGAGAAAVKLGFFGMLAKFFGKAGKAIVLGAVAVVAAVGNFVKRLFGKKTEE